MMGMIGSITVGQDEDLAFTSYASATHSPFTTPQDAHGFTYLSAALWARCSCVAVLIALYGASASHAIPAELHSTAEPSGVLIVGHMHLHIKQSARLERGPRKRNELQNLNVLFKQVADFVR